MKSIAMLLLAAAPLFLVQAQTTITKADMTAHLKAGNTVTVYETADGVGGHFDLGDPGAGKTWDFSGMYFYKTGTEMRYIDPASTPYGTEFNAATLAMESNVDNETTYSCFRFGTDTFYLLGFTTVMNGTPIVYPQTPEQPVMQYPASFGDSWTYVGEPVDINGHVFTETRIVNTIDADGTLKLPVGTYECIRKKNVTYSTTKVIVGGQVYSESVSRAVSYEFITKEGIAATMVVDSMFENSSFPFLQSLTYSVTGEVSPVADVEVPSALTLDAVYPNPLTQGGDVRITWTSDVRGEVAVRIYNVCGVRVMDVYEGSSIPGTMTREVHTAGLAPGLYFVRLQTGGMQSTAPMSIIH